MANYRYFADISNGETVELSKVWHDGHISTKVEHFFGRGPNGEKLQATRMIEYKAFASKHECDDRCMFAKGRIMKCECACGGKNHGKGRVTFACEAA